MCVLVRTPSGVLPVNSVVSHRDVRAGHLVECYLSAVWLATGVCVLARTPSGMLPVSSVDTEWSVTCQQCGKSQGFVCWPEHLVKCYLSAVWLVTGVFVLASTPSGVLPVRSMVYHRGCVCWPGHLVECYLSEEWLVTWVCVLVRTPSGVLPVSSVVNHTDVCAGQDT
ncbi:hypothetical protein DPMN_067376 [Dreissena polymorpha]|uniref:Uncharacterized protein n=1 Tax=Dreissena polymorpha TaxID=45954 RepID=A0A9D3YV67_DREPO|nr:hypothetical protein DPMN_067376 [Dreissena polymorpha]